MQSLLSSYSQIISTSLNMLQFYSTVVIVPDLQIGYRFKTTVDAQENHNSVHYTLLSLILQLEFICCLINSFASCMVLINQCSKLQKIVTSTGSGAYG